MDELKMPENTPHGIKRIIAVMSGKGGVGRSTVTGLLAASLQRQGLQIGVLDGNFAYPIMPELFGVRNQSPTFDGESFGPPLSEKEIKVMWAGILDVTSEHEYEPIIWRGPIIAHALMELFHDMAWGDLDYLFIDAPSGTSDIPLAIMHELPLDGVLIVTSPQKTVTSTVARCVTMVRQSQHPIIGVIENFSYLDKPDKQRYELYQQSYIEHLVACTQAPLLARLPLDPALTALCDAGRVEDYHSLSVDSLATEFLKAIELQAR